MLIPTQQVQQGACKTCALEHTRKQLLALDADRVVTHWCSSFQAAMYALTSCHLLVSIYSVDMEVWHKKAG